MSMILGEPSQERAADTKKGYTEVPPFLSEDRRRQNWKPAPAPNVPVPRVTTRPIATSPEGMLSRNRF